MAQTIPSPLKVVSQDPPKPKGQYIFPTPFRVIVKLDEFKYEGRIVIPDTAKRKSTTGVVIAVGDGVENIKVGDKLLFGILSGTLIMLRNRPSLQILRQDEVLAILKPEELLEDAVT